MEQNDFAQDWLFLFLCLGGDFLAWCFADPAVCNMHSALFTGWKVNTGLTFLFAPTSHTCVMSIIALPLSGTDKTTMGMGVEQ